MHFTRGHNRMRLAALVAVALVAWACGDSGPTPSPSPRASVSPTPSPTATPTPTPTPTDAVLSATQSFGPNAVASLPPASTPAPRLPALPPRTVTIAAAGDIACDPAHNTKQPQDCDQMATAALLGALNPTAVLTLGDNQYQDGTLQGFQTIYDASWGQYKRKTYPTIGNHEYLTSGAAGYFGYFHFPAYYSFNLGDWHVISLDSECSFVRGCQVGSAQEKWLKADLAANPRLCTLVTWHEPRWSSGQHGNARQMSAIWADLVATGVDVVLSGHNHDYERFTFLDANGNPNPAGTMQFVVGTGGKNDYSFAAAPLTGEIVRGSGFFGVLSMRLGPSSFSWRFVAAPGFSFADSGSANCH
jgi:acid phosphatase type 7